MKWIESIEVRQSPLLSRARGRMFKAGQRLNLSKVTLLVGSNGLGKTALYDWIGAGTVEDSLSRWVGSELDFSLTIYNPGRHSLAVRSVNNDFVFQLDDVRVPFNPLPVAVQTLAWPPHLPRDLSDLEWIAGWLGTTVQVVRRLADALNRTPNAFLERISIEEDGKISTKLFAEQHPFSLKQLGGGSTVCLGLAFAISRAANSGLHAPTLLILDDVLTALDPMSKALALAELGRQDRFQSLLSLPNDDPHLEWGGWSLAHIIPGPDGSTIDGA